MSRINPAAITKNIAILIRVNILEVDESVSEEASKEGTNN